MGSFLNRTDAANQLADALSSYEDTEAVVLAIPRGGVPVGAIVARQLHLAFDLLLIKKLSHPLSSELAIGAVGMHERLITNRMEVSEEFIESETDRLRRALKEQHQLFLDGRSPVEIKGKTAILVDDGMATGSTVMAAVDILRNRDPDKIVVAVPVAPPDTKRKVAQKVDDMICLMTPDDFRGVGQFYREFYQVSNEDVVKIMNEFD